MLKAIIKPASVHLQHYVYSYGMITGRIDSSPLIIPLAARPKQLLTFHFANRFDVLSSSLERITTSPRVVVVGPQSCSQPGLSAYGQIDNFTIHFQPSGFNALFGIPMSELADFAFDAHGVIGSQVSVLERELCDTQDFAERIRITEKHLMRLARLQDRPDGVAIAANSLYARHGLIDVKSMATFCGISIRQFERRFAAQIGVSPKLFARIIRFNAVVDNKLRAPNAAWSHIAQERDYHDQMHLVHDCKAFTGESPTQFMKRLGGVPGFQNFYRTAKQVHGN